MGQRPGISTPISGSLFRTPAWWEWWGSVVGFIKQGLNDELDWGAGEIG